MSASVVYNFDNDKEFIERESHTRHIEIIVEDSGIGLSSERSKKIFDRFYQIDDSEKSRSIMMNLGTVGSGIGLALTKDIIELHKGRIFVESEEGKGSRFIVLVPIDKSVYSEQECQSIMGHVIEKQDVYERVAAVDEFLNKTDTEEYTENFNNAEEEKLLDKGKLLIVEDNPEVRNYLKDLLKSSYEIFVAKDGEEGVEIAKEMLPDLIISDVMMPNADGIELITALNNDETTNHIPVVFLTAKSSEQAEIQALESGAIDYITKPFSPEILFFKLNNLYTTRQRLKAKYKKEIILQPKELTITSNEEMFLTKAMTVVEEYISDSSFDVSKFVSEMGMSRSVLYRKLDSVIGQSANEFIRQVRLKRAAQYLQANQMTIAEISYAVGFNDPQYFSKCFSKEFRETPSAYSAKYKKSIQD
jgi:DNA-binding response OmpR family regulator